MSGGWNNKVCKPRGQDACLSHLLRSVPLWSEEAVFWSSLLQSTSCVGAVQCSLQCSGGEIKLTTERRPSKQVRRLPEAGEGLCDQPGKLSALGREERGRFQDWDLFCLLWSPSGWGGSKGRPDEPGKGTRLSTQSHALGRSHSKLPWQSQVSAGPLGHQLGRSQRVLAVGRCHKIPRSQQSCPWDAVGTCHQKS